MKKSDITILVADDDPDYLLLKSIIKL